MGGGLDVGPVLVPQRMRRGMGGVDMSDGFAWATIIDTPLGGKSSVGR